MQPLASKFIELLESKQLLSDEVLSELRRQVAQSKVKLSPELIAKLLVDNGHLTRFQATKLVAELAQTESLPIPSSSSSKPTSPIDELGLAADSQVAEIVLDESEDLIVEVEEIHEVDVVDEAAPIAQATELIESRSLGSTYTASGSHSSAAALELAPRPIRPNKVTKSSTNPWDSFRILGIGTITALVLVAGFFLVRWAWRGNAETALKKADDAYQQRSYETATEMYQEFFRNWPTNERASYAKVRRALAALRKDIEAASNPVIALRTANEFLPPIASEPGLADQQADITGALLSLAEKFVIKADGIKEIDQRKEVMEEMTKLMEMINDPKFVSSAQRTAQSPTLLKIEESRSRIVREIGREDELIVALKEIDTALDAKQVAQAYQIRKNLVNRHPVLEANPLLVERVQKASSTQLQLVQSGQNSAKLRPANAEPEIFRTYTLAHRDGQTIDELQGNILCYQVKGSVFAVRASDGEVLWSRFVGRGLDTMPVRLSASGNADLLIVQAESGQLHRVAAETGETRWSLDFSETIMVPVVDAEDIAVATGSGKIFNLDAQSGQTKWVQLLPQAVNVSPCMVSGRQFIYQPADHSNLYVLDRKNGSCAEVYYLGHERGAMKTPPLLYKGIMFIVDNISNDAAKIRILQPSENGIQRIQEALNIEGNVIHPPALDRQQILYQSDLGNSILIEIESASAKQKVTILDSVPKIFDRPHLCWTAFANNLVWMADDRLARFDFTPSTGRLNRKWIQLEGDQFVAPLLIAEKTLFHARRLRGNQGVRVSAVRTEDGQRIWQVDLSEPITWIAKKQTSGLGAVTSSGNYFQLAGKPITNRADVVCGEGKPQKWFDQPVRLASGSTLLFNRSNPKEFALGADEGTPLRLIPLAVGTASPSCQAVSVGDKAVVGLDNGQMLMFDPKTGSLAGPPYQPSMAPNIKVQWNRPVYLPESRTLIVANDQQQIARLDASQSLRQLAAEQIEFPLVGPLLAVGQQIVGVRRRNNVHELVLIDPTSLSQKAADRLDGNVVSGPFPGREGTALLQLDSGVTAFDQFGKIQWTVACPASPIVDAPAVTDNSIIWGNRQGQIWVVDPEGQVTGSSDLGQPFSSAPLLIDQNRLLIGSSEGSVLATTVPRTHQLSGAQQ